MSLLGIQKFIELQNLIIDVLMKESTCLTVNGFNGHDILSVVFTFQSNK